MAIVKVMMMQKNEGPRLARWLTHYGQIFGMENLLIFDNGSSDKFTISLLNEAEYRGAHVRRDLNRPVDFQMKGQHYNNVIASLDHDEEYDFALPVDCDETLCVFTEGGLSLDARDIHAEFERLKSYRGAFSIGLSLFNVPNREGWYAPNRFFPKGFVPARCGARIDNGHHFPTSSEVPESFLTRFTYLHNHHRPYREMIRNARAKLALEVENVTDKELLREHARRALPGGHLVHLLLGTQADYYTMYKNEVQLYFQGNDVLLQEPGKKNVRYWDAKRYRECHPDTVVYEAGLLSHYLTYGAPEGRELP
ncbi:hypothetical protein GS501_05695 [Saccharibacter sp. 17.LH.SD]|uniref:glycosyltransferase family 2 protein n=1 Tax=Saccharibacter sp. 17.LH.SD TaxID=2689393 RepID=UPI00136C145C|nr:glycosyltransferase family 2 protein [Saccharibacter sp. 17.LH.SD]MXV44541.1 hypothetical protein [Saccharibacter sp. 17.LH.SD]